MMFVPRLMTSWGFVITIAPHPGLYVADDVLLLEHVELSFHTTSILQNRVEACTMFSSFLLRVASSPGFSED
jgi:hypothetical protein